jgi:polysaccharide biosynthesis/export protein
MRKLGVQISELFSLTRALRVVLTSHVPGYNGGGRSLFLPGRHALRTPTTLFGIIVACVVLSGMTALGATDDNSPDVTPPPAPVASDYRLGPEDLIDVFVWKEPDLSTTVVVRPDGKISLPLANELEASGKTAAELQQEIVDRLRKYVTQPVVSVMVKQINSMKISVLGEVRKPDVYRIKNRVTVLDAIAMAGGFTDLARPTRVIVLRNTAAGPQRIKINVKQVVTGDDQAPIYLQPMDTVYVE